MANHHYLNWIRTLPCAICGKPANAHHVRRFGERADDYRAVPLCPGCHQYGPAAVHRIGRRQFQALFRIDLEELIARLNATWQSLNQSAA